MPATDATMSFDTAYPRDMRGYGRMPPDPKWPGGAHVAVQFVMNYEEGGESCVLHGDAASEAFLSEITGAQPWVGERHMNMESLYEYGARAGFWRLHRLFTERRAALTVFAVTHALMRGEDQTRAMLEAGWEIASHGLKWIDYRTVPEETERAHIADAVALHTKLTGTAPVGLYQGRASVNTLRLAMEHGGFLYSADSYADDLPYWIKGPKGPFLIVPYTLDANDMRYSVSPGYGTGEQFFTYLKETFDQLYEEGRRGTPKMFSIGLHNRLVGRPGRARALARFLDYVQSHDKAWIATRRDIAEHWRRTHPPTVT
jgi:putative urate catabolism protein